MSNHPIVVERTFNAPADKVWRAITDRDEMKKWYFDIENFKPVVGLEFSFYGGDEKKQYLHLCKITEVIPGKKISYTWRYEDDAADTLVTFEIFPAGNTTTVRLTHEGVERFSKDNPALAKENFIQGWTEIVGTNLKGYLEGAK